MSSDIKINTFISRLGKKSFQGLTIEAFAKKIGVSSASVSRYIRKQGFLNYKNYQYYLQNEDLVYNEKNSWTNTISSFENKLSDMFSDIKNSKRIISIGFGSSSHAPRELAVGLCQLGFPGIHFNQFQDILFVLPSLKKSDLVLVFSEKAKNREIVFLLNQFQKCSANCWLIGAYRKFKNVKNAVIVEEERTEIISSSNEESMITQNIFALKLLRYCKSKFKLSEYRLKCNELLNEWNK